MHKYGAQNGLFDISGVWHKMFLGKLEQFPHCRVASALFWRFVQSNIQLCFVRAMNIPGLEGLAPHDLDFTDNVWIHGNLNAVIPDAPQREGLDSALQLGRKERDEEIHQLLGIIMCGAFFKAMVLATETIDVQEVWNEGR
eukprot:TRINITY_DN63322_c0_g1_i1.p1 TRINITY_DN63322_c0_g1~~TRINITY_DN63322_c0_g1_i1.p1  ORF type:complete len:141 (-),score=21.56 TRINITY_DN63322_c0_g1_i1:279-701(-)